MSAAHISNNSSVSALGMERLLSGARSAWFRLIDAARFAFQDRPDTAPSVLTPFQEAEKLRALADDVLAQDPRFAQDLYAHADRVELAGQA